MNDFRRASFRRRMGEDDPEDRTRSWTDTSSIVLSLDDFKNFFVVDSTSEKHWATLMCKFNATCDESGEIMLHAACDAGCKDPNLLKKLLQLGVDPDVVGESPDEVAVHLVTSGRVGKTGLLKAEILAKCRPDLTVKNSKQRTPKAAAHSLQALGRIKMNGIARVWENAERLERLGLPSLAQLAHDKDWFAVQNLCRRRVVEEDDKRQVYEEKTAIEWARFYGESDIEKELLYFLNGVVHGMGEGEKKPPADDASGADSKQDLKEMQGEMSTLKKENADLKIKLDNQMEELNEKMKKLVENMERSNVERKVETEVLRAEIKGLKDQLSTTLPLIVASSVSTVLAAAASGHPSWAIAAAPVSEPVDG